MKRIWLAWPLLLFALAHCSSAAPVCPEAQLFVDGRCVDLCEDIDCDDDNDCTFEECVVNEQALTASCVRTDAEDGRACDTPEGAPGFCTAGRCAGACDPPDCDDGNACTINGTCNASTGECEGGRNAQEDTECNDTGVCDSTGSCVECNRPQQCDDANECTQDSCEGGSCGHENIAGRVCDYMGGSQNGICDAQGECGAPPPNCDPNPCTDTGNDCTESVCDPADGSCSARDLGDGTACNDASGGFPGTCSSGACVGLCAGKQCPDPPVCLMPGTCNPQDGVCEEGDPVMDGTDCEVGMVSGACVEGVCAAPDDEVDPVTPLMMEFDRGPDSSTNTVSFPLGDTEDNVPYRVQDTGSIGFFGNLTIRADCTGPGTEHVKFFWGGRPEEHACGTIVVDAIVTNDSNNTGSVNVRALGGDATLVEWTLTGEAK